MNTRPFHPSPVWALLVAFAMFSAGCANSPLSKETPVIAKPQLQFIDLQGFDRDLAGSLGTSLPKVEITFYDRITPSALPERLQKWMASVESGGGTVKITPPPSTVTAKNPFLLISAASTLWSANKMAKEASTNAQFRVAQGYDADVLLKVDDSGNTVVDKLIFSQRKK